MGRSLRLGLPNRTGPALRTGGGGTRSPRKGKCRRNMDRGNGRMPEPIQHGCLLYRPDSRATRESCRRPIRGRNRSIASYSRDLEGGLPSTRSFTLPTQSRSLGRGQTERWSARPPWNVSYRAEPNISTSAMVAPPSNRLTHPFRVKKARFTRDRSVGRTTACSAARRMAVTAAAPQ